jgi:hypothetical protein
MENVGRKVFKKLWVLQVLIIICVHLSTFQTLDKINLPDQPVVRRCQRTRSGQ